MLATNDTQITLKNVRCSFPHLFEPYAGPNGQQGKYSMQVIMPENHPQTNDLRKAILVAAKNKFPSKVKGNIFPGGLKDPLRAGTEKEDDYPEYKGQLFFNASSKRRPAVCDRAKNLLGAEDNVIYPGCYVNVSVNCYGFDVSGNKGVAIGLNAVQFVKDGDPLGGSSMNALNDFEVLDEDDGGSEEVSFPYGNNIL